MQDDRADDQPLAKHIDDNIESVAALHRRESETVSPSQWRVERLSRFMGRPTYLMALLALIALWVIYNATARFWGLEPFDPPPFAILAGLMSFLGLVTATSVLIAQQRQAKLEQQHTHLDLQVSLLTEQKASKLIHLIEELRRDLPMVRDRVDAQAAAMQERTDATRVLSAIEEVGLAGGLDAPPPKDKAEPSE